MLLLPTACFFLLLLLQFYRAEYSFLFLPCAWSLLNPRLHLLSSLHLASGTTSSSPSLLPHLGSIQNQMGMKLMVDFGMIPVNPMGLGNSLLSSSFVGDLKRKFRKMVVRNRKSSILARPSPKQSRFPEEERGKDTGPEAALTAASPQHPVRSCVLLWRRSFYTGA